LKQNAEWIKSNAAVSVQIEGHCDQRGTIEYNLALGERRAQTVRSYLIGLGVPSGRLNIISYGEEKLIAKGDSESDHSKNRRANFVPISQ
jgi:peptidoglycan-associated lipoprotein